MGWGRVRTGGVGRVRGEEEGDGGRRVLEERTRSGLKVVLGHRSRDPSRWVSGVRFGTSRRPVPHPSSVTGGVSVVSPYVRLSVYEVGTLKTKSLVHYDFTLSSYKTRVFGRRLRLSLLEPRYRLKPQTTYTRLRETWVVERFFFHSPPPPSIPDPPSKDPLTSSPTGVVPTPYSLRRQTLLTWTVLRVPRDLYL